MKKRSFPPVAGERPGVLILGSLPGEESLRQQQYYAHPRNAFWPIMGELFGFDPALPYPERLERLTAAGVALWDTIGAGRREGSLDGNIRDAESNPVAALLEKFPSIGLICCNGGKSFEELKRSAPELFDRPALRIERLPSTSPAAAMYRYADKLAAWRIVGEFLRKSGRND